MLLGNSTVLNKSPMRKFAGTTESAERSNWGNSGARRNFQLQDRASKANQLFALPDGAYAGLAWFLPQKIGAMSSHSAATVTVGATATAYGGITTDGTAQVAFTVADADGQLISSGAGSATIAFTVADLVLTASLGGTGLASFEITAADAPLGAEASLNGSTSFTLSVGSATAYPLNDASPLREGTASFAISGSLVPYAIGHMGGSTVGTGVLTVDAITAALIAAALATPLAANIKQVNDVAVTGTGAAGNEWGPV